jgi:7-cyano-7-deazaguanine reductase
MSQCFKMKLGKTFVQGGGFGEAEMEAEQKMPIDKYSLKRFDIQEEDVIDVNILEAIPFDYPDSGTEVSYETDEFTSVCPWTGLPDFARLIIRYVPHRYVVELKSLKYYLTSYRNVGILQEHAVNRILSDLVQLLQPASMAVEAYFRERGGLSTQAIAKYEKEKGVSRQSQ